MSLQVKLQGVLGPLRKELKEALALTSKEKKETTEWQRKVKNKRETIAGEFNKLHKLLREEEQLLVQSLEEEERETLQRLQENVTKLSQQSSSLQQLITEIEEKCQQPVVELLKDVKSTLSRSESMKLQEPEAVSTDLKNVYKISLDMREVLKRFGGEWSLLGHSAVLCLGIWTEPGTPGHAWTQLTGLELCDSWRLMCSVLGSLPDIRTH
nr:E3 ubiquitin-protein ligase TRIM11-like [Chrysemys picta bellii]